MDRKHLYYEYYGIDRFKDHQYRGLPWRGGSLDLGVVSMQILALNTMQGRKALMAYRAKICIITVIVRSRRPHTHNSRRQ